MSIRRLESFIFESAYLIPSLLRSDGVMYIPCPNNLFYSLLGFQKPQTPRSALRPRKSWSHRWRRLFKSHKNFRDRQQAYNIWSRRARQISQKHGGWDASRVSSWKKRWSSERNPQIRLGYADESRQDGSALQISQLLSKRSQKSPVKVSRFRILN